jgi:hypothetical protein
VGDADVDVYSLSAPVCADGSPASATSPSFGAGQQPRKAPQPAGLGVQRQRLLDALPANRLFPNGFPPTRRQPRATAGRKASTDAAAVADAATGAVAAFRTRALDAYAYEPCWEAATTAYLNRRDVRTALHVDHFRAWAECDDGVFDHYDAASQAAPMEGVYLRLIRAYDYAALGMAPLKLLVYSGDDDAVCGTHGTMSWVLALGLQVEAYWQPWRFQDEDYGQRLAGYSSCMTAKHTLFLAQGHFLADLRACICFLVFTHSSRGFPRLSLFFSQSLPRCVFRRLVSPLSAVALCHQLLHRARRSPLRNCARRRP